MRYQPAYVYPGAQKLDRTPVKQARGWKFQRPHLNIDQHTSVRLLRFGLIVLGLLLIVVGVAHFSTAYVAQNWDQVSATVTRSEVVRMKTDDSVPVFAAKIEYEYVKDGVTYSGTRVDVAPIRSQSPGEVKRMISAYSVGRTVLAHVNPDRADKTFLKADPLPYLYSLIIPGIIMVLFSLAIAQVLYINAERKQRKAWRFGEFKGPVADAA